MKKYLILLLILTGCESMRHGTKQIVAIDTVPASQCTLANNSGMWNIEAPNAITIDRDQSDLVITCRKGDKYAQKIIKSEKKEGLYKNAFMLGLVGYPVGAYVDGKTGASYQYQQNISLSLK